MSRATQNQNQEVVGHIMIVVIVASILTQKGKVLKILVTLALVIITN
jgi:hypothetical protein